MSIHLPAIYMHCPRYSNVGVVVCKASMLQLTGEDLYWIALYYANIFGVVVFTASILN